MCMHAHMTALTRLRGGAVAVAKVVCDRQEEAGTALANCLLSAACGADRACVCNAHWRRL